MKKILAKKETVSAGELEKLGFEDGQTAYRNLKLLAKTPLNAVLDLVVEKALASPSPDQALTNLERITENKPAATLKRLAKDPKLTACLVTLAGSSPYLSSILAQSVEFFEELFFDEGGEGGEGAKGGDRGGALNARKDLETFTRELGEWTQGAETFDAMGAALRVYKKREYLRIGSRDLLGLAPMEEVTGELSDLASAALEEAHKFSLEELKKTHGAPVYIGDDGPEREMEHEIEREAGFSVISLGKLGGRELNFSSDIDIIYVYSTERGETRGVGEARGVGETRGVGEARTGSIPLHQFFVKLSERITRLISRVTEDGFVFRVDLDLRPGGRSGEIANSLRSAEIYYESWGQTWERGAMIKARHVAGDPEVGERFIKMIRPFVYRRSMDFTAIEEIKSMKERIDLVLLKRSPDTVDVKLGAGGIREIEFFCQALELIHGGRNPEVRQRNTLEAIKSLEEKKFLGPNDALDLSRAYRFLRNLEHRIQIVECRQTQAIPAAPRELARLAGMMGFKDTDTKTAGESFWEEYRQLTGRVYSIYRTLFYSAGEDLLRDVDESILVLLSPEINRVDMIKGLKKLGFKDTEKASKVLGLLRDGPPSMNLLPRVRVVLAKVAPYILAKVVASPDPEMALGHVEGFLSAIGRRTSLYAMLAENPPLIDELVKIFGSSQFLSRTLIERPESIDLLLSAELARPERSREELERELEKSLSTAGDFESKLDAMRRFRNLEIFRIGTNDAMGKITFDEVYAQITAMAEAALGAALVVAREELEGKYGRAEAGFIVVGLGGLGGGELGYGSDLDIVFVYSDEGEDGGGGGGGERVSTGPKVVSYHEYFVLLAQKIISVLTTRTAEGRVFNVDARLRPTGSAGPLVLSSTAFIEYHREKAAVWERQAALKARLVAGSRKFGARVLTELEAAVYSRPPTKEELRELLRIRKRMEEELARETPTRFNIKTGRGGLVDIEFLVQALQLCYGSGRGGAPGRGGRGGNVLLRTPYTLKALEALKNSGLVNEDDYFILTRAHAFYRAVETRLRIVHDRPGGSLDLEKSDELLSLAKRMGYRGEAAARTLAEERKTFAEKVRAIYDRTMEGLSSN